MSFLLLFHNRLEDSSQLIEGRLLLIEKSTDSIKNIYRATSGCANWQEYDEISARGKGSIPPQNLVGIDHYIVSTNPIYMPRTKGVEGNFYKINPHDVTIAGVGRGDFGIHQDANVPGSAGCIVLTSAVGWKGFQEDMEFLSSLTIFQVPLLISYAH